MEAMAYCPACKEEVEFSTKVEQSSTQLDGVDYAYERRVAYCKQCGNSAAYAPYTEEAGKAFEDSVRQAKGIVPLAIVRDLPKKYGIGKRPLSRLLGWGEHTYARFVDGAVPSKEYSDAIQGFYSNPALFYEYLKSHKDRITSAALKKSSAVTKQVIENEYPDAVRTLDVADYFNAKAQGDITNSALNKLVYYAQGFSWPFSGDFLINQRPKAWTYGPVYGQVWHTYKAVGKEDGFEDRARGFESPFCGEEEQLLDAVYEAFGGYSGGALSRMTHEETPWLNARERGGAHEGENCEEAIKLEDMKSYFEYAVEQLDISTFDDLKRYPAEMRRINEAAPLRAHQSAGSWQVGGRRREGGA